MKPPVGSQRTCCVCGECSERRSLLRLALVGGRLFLDGEGKLGGRGAYVHSTEGCLKSLSVKSLMRGFRGRLKGYKSGEINSLIESVKGRLREEPLEKKISEGRRHSSPVTAGTGMKLKL